MLPIELQILKYYLFEKPIYHTKIKPFFNSDSYRKLARSLETYQPDPQLAKKHLDDVTYTVFDLETTGLIPEVGHEIISIGAVQIKGVHYCRKEKFYRIVRPIRPVPGVITELTGLDREKIMHGQTFIDAFAAFFEYSRDTVLVAHPAKFDVRFLQTMLKRWKLPSYQPYVIDSQQIAKWVLPRQNCQLDSLIRHYTIDYLERHHALNDAIMTAELFEYLLNEVKNKGITSYDSLTPVLAGQKNNASFFNHRSKEWS